MCFWTIFTQLGLQLFYFSVWELGTSCLLNLTPIGSRLHYTLELALSGSELALLATLSPWFLTYPSVSRFSTSRRGTLILRALSLVFGLGAYKLPLPSLRLLAVVLGNVFAWMEVAATSKRLKGGNAARMEGSCE